MLNYFGIFFYLVESAEGLLTASQDGYVMRYKMTNSPYLVGWRQMRLDKVEGKIDGLQQLEEKKYKICQANR